MESPNDYYGYAEDDYYFLMKCLNNGEKANIICVCTQNTCEKYLKYVITRYIYDESYSRKKEVLRSHSLKKLIKYIESNTEDFIINKQKLMLVDGFYFEMKYPGSDSYYNSEEDIQSCMIALKECKYSVDFFIDLKEKEKIINQNRKRTKELVKSVNENYDNNKVKLKPIDMHYNEHKNDIIKANKNKFYIED